MPVQMIHRCIRPVALRRRPSLAFCMKSPRVSIIIVNWNGRRLFEQCLPSVLASEYSNFEVVVADNASTDDSVEWLERNAPDVRVVSHPENLLYAAGNNGAVPSTDGEYLCFLNNDVEVPPDWLSPLVDQLERAPDVAAVQPKLLQHVERGHFEYAGASGGFLDDLGYPFARGRLFDTLEPDDGQYEDARDVFWASGAALLVRGSAFEACGGFDERFQMHMEEIDLAWAFHRRGWRVRVEPASEVYHIGGASLPQTDPRKLYLNFRNSLLLLYKHSSPRRWASVFPRRLTLDSAAAKRAALGGRFAEARAIIRAYADAHKMKHLFAADRPSSKEMVLPSYRGSIAFDYFIRGRKTFDALPLGRFR